MSQQQRESARARAQRERESVLSHFLGYFWISKTHRCCLQKKTHHEPVRFTKQNPTFYADRCVFSSSSLIHRLLITGGMRDESLCARDTSPISPPNALENVQAASCSYSHSAFSTCAWTLVCLYLCGFKRLEETENRIDFGAVLTRERRR